MTPDEEKAKKDVKPVEFPRGKDGTLECDKVEGTDRQKCLVQKTKEGAAKNLKQAMGVKDKPKEKPSEKPAE